MSHATKKPRVEEMSEQELVEGFLDVANRAMSKHADKFPFKQLMALSNTIIGDRSIAIGIYKDDSSNTYDHYTYRFQDGKFQMVEHGKVKHAIEWKASRDYLEEVVENPQEYIDNPFKLDFDWLKSRLGMELD